MSGTQNITNINAIAVARGSSAPSNTEVYWIDTSITGEIYEKAKVYDGNDWVLVNRTNAQLLADLKKVDGAGSGLDADTLQGLTPAQLMSGGGGGGSVPALSLGQMLVGQADTIGTAQNIGGIATIDASGNLSYVPGTISHTDLTNIGTNTHAQIDTHIANTSNPHGVTASQVGNTTAQWNANQIDGNNATIGTLGAGQDGQVLTWDNGTSQFIMSSAGGDSIYTASGTVPSSIVATLTDNITFTGGQFNLVGSGTTDATKAFFVENNSGTDLFEIRDSGQIGYGGAYISTDAHAFSNPNGESNILAAYDGTDQRFRVNSSGHLQIGLTSTNWQHRFRSQSGVGYIELRNTSGTETMSLQTNNSGYYNNAFRFGSTSAASNDCLVEFTSTDRANRITPMTSAQASLITPLEGMWLVVSDTNGTFTSIGFWGYENGAWVKL